MMSLGQIQALSQKVAAEAAAERREPFVVEEVDIELWQAAIRHGVLPRLPFPALGDYVPEGWELLEEFFVDALGWDLHDAGGPAMSVAEFVNSLEPGFGYALTEQGQFQVYVGKFREDQSETV